MAKPRKMLGRVEDAAIQGLMELISTQSRETLAAWAAGFVRAAYLPIYEMACPGDERPRAALDGCERCLAGTMAWKEMKLLGKEARSAAVEAEALPAAQAAARAIATACGVYNTPTNALGFVFYGAAAAAYSAEGIQAPPARLDQLALREEERILESLRAVAVAEEPCPVKVAWNC